MIDVIVYKHQGGVDYEAKLINFIHIPGLEAIQGMVTIDGSAWPVDYDLIEIKEGQQ